MDIQNEDKGLNRRDFIKVGGMSTIALTVVSAGIPGKNLLNTVAHAEKNDHAKLQFKPDGKFKIVQFNDTQDDERIDRWTGFSRISNLGLDPV
ncbi:hypothetical protein [Bacillus xiapuensis]|uniref:Twin-arginine translocation signal domain-containing protein n=1 Tax=Bacillus xiapuensis TaxID=2014075 RepID=A0ABU6N669_9BACI|nr:hypothetical protein [Bacillus xiapuensis]